MPSPIPVKITPLARPRRATGTTRRMPGAASTISTPPATPAAKRQTENHGNDIPATRPGALQAMNATLASTIIARMSGAIGSPASRLAASAPAR